MSIREIIDSLPRDVHNQLMSSFNNGIPEHYEYETGCFIGVNIDPLVFPKLTITESRGKWCLGTLQ